MNVTLSSLLIATYINASNFLSFPSRYNSLTLSQSKFERFISPFISIHILPHRNHYFLFNEIDFHQFYNSVIKVEQNILSEQVQCINLVSSSFTRNETMTLNQAGCNIIRKVKFTSSYSQISLIDCSSNDFILYVENCTFDKCSLCFKVNYSSLNVTDTFFFDCESNTENSSAIAVASNTNSVYFANIYISDAYPSAFYMTNYSFILINASLSLTKNTTTDIHSSMIYIENCAKILINNSILANEVKESTKNGISIVNSHEVVFNLIYFRNFVNYSVLLDNSIIVMTYVCFPLEENESIYNINSIASNIATEVVIYNPECQFTPEPTPVLTKTDKIYGIVTIVIFSVFFVILFIVFIRCIFKNRNLQRERYGTLDNQSFNDDISSYDVSD